MKKFIVIWLVLLYSVFGASDVEKLQRQLDKALPVERVRLLIDIAEILWNESREEAAVYYKKAIKEARILGNPKLLGDGLFVYGRKLYFWGELDSSAVYLQQSLDICRSIADSSGIGKCLSHLGLLNWLLNEQVIAKRYLEEALGIQRALNDNREVGKILTNIGNFYRQWGDYREALKYYLEALEKYQSDNYREGIAWLHFSSSLLYKQMNDYENALKYIELSLASYKELASVSHDSGGVMICYGQLGDLYRLTGNLDKGLEYQFLALRLRRKTGVDVSIADGLSNIGQSYYEMGKDSVALDYLLQSLELRENIKDVTGRATNLKYLGFIYHRLGDDQKSLYYLNQGLEAAQIRIDRANESDILNYISKIYYQNHETDSAFKYLNLYSSVKDSIFSDRVSSRIASLQIQYDLKEQEQKNQRLEQNVRINELEIARQKSRGNYMILLILLGAVIIAGFFVQYQIKAKSHRIIVKARDQLAQEIEERKVVEKEREKLITEQKEALAKIKTLTGLIPICANCKKIRNDEGYYERVEKYIMDHSDVVFSHGICPECLAELYPDFKDLRDKNNNT